MSKVIGKKESLKEFISYQDGSIVSKTLIDKGCRIVTLFAFDKEQKLSEHTAPYDALVYILDGECEIKIANETHDLFEGDFIIMPANVPHSVRAKRRFKMLLVMIREKQ